MDIVYDVLLLESVWMAVQLLPVQMAVQEHGVTASGEHAAGFFMGVHRGCHSLFAKDAGQYRVHIKAVCPFLKKNNSRQNGFKLSQLAVASALVNAQQQQQNKKENFLSRERQGERKVIPGLEKSKKERAVKKGEVLWEWGWYCAIPKRNRQAVRTDWPTCNGFVG